MNDKPEAGKVYALTGKSNEASIMRGDSWAASEVKPDHHGQHLAAGVLCRECERRFDLTDVRQADEWYNGHDCEV